MGSVVPTGKKVGRPSRLTPALQDKILKLIRAGNYDHVAARAVNVHPSLFCDWMAKGRKHAEAGEDSQFREFYEAVISCRAMAEVEAVNSIRVAHREGGQWTAAMTYLERK